MPDLKPLKIALITSYPPDLTTGSGVVRMILGYGRSLKQCGHQVTILHPRFKATSYLNLAVQRLTFNKRLRISKDDFDLLIVSDFDGFTLKDSAIPKIALNAGILADIVQFEKGLSARILSHLARRECQNVQSADLVVVPSRYTALKISEYYRVPEEKVAVVPLGIDPLFWQKQLPQKPVAGNHEIQILCVARQYPRKGIADLLRAFQKVRSINNNVHLVLVGGGPELKANKELARQLNIAAQVNFVGDLADQQQLASYYARADIFCLPSYHETFGLVFLEAMFFKLPIVTYASTAIPEVVKQHFGFLCQPGNIDCLARKLLTLLNDARLRNKMGQLGQQQVKQFNWLASAKRLLSLAADIAF